MDKSKKKLLERYDVLISRGQRLIGAPDKDKVAHAQIHTWMINAKSLVAKTCDSRSLELFMYSGRWSVESDLVHRLPTLVGLKEDYEFGMFDDGRALIEAEIFDHQLDQSKELLRKKYKEPAAVVAGVVLETKLRELCDKHEIEIVLQKGGKLKAAGMNEKLAKKGAYDLLWKTKIEGFLRIRNAGAHPKDESVVFSHGDVEDMIKGVGQFIRLRIGSPV